MPRPFRRRLAAAAVCFAGLLSGCSPTFNWREVPVADDGLVALLPCKADRATRTLPLGSASVTVDMTGCAAGGATFAVAHAVAADPAQAADWMGAWQAATRAQIGDGAVVESPAVLARAAADPAPVRLDTRTGAGSRAEPQNAAAAHILWFAQPSAGKVSLYQATVIGQPSSSDALTSFFEGLRLP